MYIEQVFIDGLACTSYLIGCDSHGIAAVIDPDRDVQRYLDIASARNLKITHIIETHLHADHVSGNTDLRQRTKADIYVYESAEAGFEHKPVTEGDVLELGNVRLMARHTPGHTPDSMTLLVSDTTRGTDTWLALTGDTLFVGDMGRPDLVGPDAARELAEQMHASLNDVLLKLDDGVLVYPGHGAGSLCGKSIGAVRSTTIGYERRFNPALSQRPLNEFIEFAISDLPEQPGNHRFIKALNRSGPQPLGEPAMKALTVEDSIPHFQGGAVLLDVRPHAEYVEAHAPGSVHLEADEQLSNRVGFILPPQASLILLGGPETDLREVALGLARVGFENIAGYLSEGMDVWQANGLPVISGDVTDLTAAELEGMLEEAAELTLVDVREPWEYARGHVPGAKLIPLGELADHVAELDPEQPLALICQSGARSLNAAALLSQKGYAQLYNVLGGTAGWAKAGFPLER